MIAIFGEAGLVGQLAIAAVQDHTGPLKVVCDVVDLDAHSWIFAHPFDLLAFGGKPVEVVGLIHEVDGHNIGLILSGTSEPADCGACQNVLAILGGHFSNSHKRSFPSRTPISRT